ncbi:MAG TPA: hypothetical protein VJS64_04870, partial [Pyrinomonadaceae bacterium]|nr:hypothetical protein [Pyrinomonadaceae bacterium]
EDDFFVVDGGYQSPPAATPVSIYYSANDIRELEKAQESNNWISAARDFIYLPEILSSIASYVQNKHASLLAVSNAESTSSINVIDIEYETTHRDRMSDRLTNSAVYELCVREHKRRGRRQNLADDRFTRFSSLCNVANHCI